MSYRYGGGGRAGGGGEGGRQCEGWCGNGDTQLHLSASEGHEHVVKWLLCNHHITHVNVNAINRDGEIPLHRACACGYLNIVSLLIEYGSNLYSFDEDGYLPIHRAVIWDFLDITKFLLTKMSLNSTLDANGNNLLHLAAYAGSEDTLSWLLAKKDFYFLTQMKNFRGQLPIEMAATRNCRILLRKHQQAPQFFRYFPSPKVSDQEYDRKTRLFEEERSLVERRAREKLEMELRLLALERIPRPKREIPCDDQPSPPAPPDLNTVAPSSSSRDGRGRGRDGRGSLISSEDLQLLNTLLSSSSSSPPPPSPTTASASAAAPPQRQRQRQRSFSDTEIEIPRAEESSEKIPSPRPRRPRRFPHPRHRIPTVVTTSTSASAEKQRSRRYQWQSRHEDRQQGQQHGHLKKIIFPAPLSYDHVTSRLHQPTQAFLQQSAIGKAIHDSFLPPPPPHAADPHHPHQWQQQQHRVVFSVRHTTPSITGEICQTTQPGTPLPSYFSEEDDHERQEEEGEEEGTSPAGAGGGVGAWDHEDHRYPITHATGGRPSHGRSGRWHPHPPPHRSTRKQNSSSCCGSSSCSISVTSELSDLLSINSSSSANHSSSFLSTDNESIATSIVSLPTPSTRPSLPLVPLSSPPRHPSARHHPHPNKSKRDKGSSRGRTSNRKREKDSDKRSSSSFLLMIQQSLSVCSSPSLSEEEEEVKGERRRRRRVTPVPSPVPSFGRKISS